MIVYVPVNYFLDLHIIVDIILHIVFCVNYSLLLLFLFWVSQLGLMFPLAVTRFFYTAINKTQVNYEHNI